MESIKVSIIVPVYNMEKYIESTLKSIEDQSLKEKEIICVDDGSTDSSYDIAIKFAEKVSNVKVLKQDNMGSGVARNLGIQNAKGEFVCFLDADDFYVTDDALEHLYNLAKQKNVVVCGGSSCDYRDGKMSTAGIRKERTFIEDKYVKREEYPGMTGYCAFLFEKNFLIENSIFFPSYLRGQDAPFFVKAIACAGGAYCCRKLVLAYRKDYKTVKYSEEKALGIVKSLRDVFKLSVQYEMMNVQHVVREELKGEIGALLYRFSYEGCKEMTKMASEFNAIAKEGMLCNDFWGNKQLLVEENGIITYVQENIEKKKEFISQLQNIENVYVFGAGTIGKKVADFLRRNQIKIQSFIVTNIKQNPLVVNGIPVKEISTVDKGKNNYIIIIATFWYAQEEIISTLKAKGYKHIYPVDLQRFFLWQDSIEH